MKTGYILAGIFVMALFTYLIRMIPMAFFRKKITNQWVQSFLYYVPYAVLAAMTFPAALYATGNIIAAAAGLIVAVLLAIKEKGLTLVAIASCITVFIVDEIMRLI